MTTIAQALERGVLEGFKLPDWETRMPQRPLYVAPAFFDWAENTPEMFEQSRKVGGRVLFEHLEQMFCDFRCAARPSAGDLRRIMPTANGIWSMHPVGLRVYGWCPAPHAFVVVTGALEIDTKTDRRLNDEKRKEVQNFIRRHGLGPTVVRGDASALFP